MVSLRLLNVSQDEIRDCSQIGAMIEYVAQGGRWTCEAVESHARQHGHKASMIAISRFPDGWLLIHDGLHRAISTFAAGREALHDDEYLLHDWRYEAYLEPNLSAGWVTPFDPRTEVRLPDFLAFKTKVLDIAKSQPAAALEYIAKHRHHYCRARRHLTVPEVAATLQVQV